MQLGVHLGRLVELEYLLVHRGGRGQSFSYELLFDGRAVAGERFIAGLVDAGELVEPASTTSTLGGQKGDFGVALGAHTGPIPGGNRPPVGSRNEHQPGSKPSLTVVIDSETHIRSEEKPESYVPARRRGASSLAARAAR